MKDEMVFAAAPETPEAVPAAERRRLSAPMIVAAAIMFLAMASYFANGVLLLLDLGVLTKGVAGVTVADGGLTTEGQRLVFAGVYLFFGVLALAVIVGFLLQRKRAWSAAMTWTALALFVDLVAYFSGEHRYLSMLAEVVVLLLLNQASIHRRFRLEEGR